jgi:membrane fusion protein, type I secretion system
MTPPTQRSIRAHLLAIAAAALVLVLGVGVIGATTELAGAIIASGALVVDTNVKKVQHPTGGIVGELYVHDGQRVAAGDLLIRLDETAAQANVAMVDKSLAELYARRARLEAERDGGDAVEFPADLLRSAAEQADIGRVVSGERRLFELRRQAQDGQKAQLRERIAQLTEEVRGYTEQAAAKGREIEFIGRELEGVRDLFSKNLIPIARVTALERDAARLEGERGQLTATIAQGKGKISETELQIIQVDQTMRSDVAKELADIRAKIAELVERRVTAVDQLRRIDIRAPQAGVVHQLSVFTKGGVIAAGEQIMLIVPQADDLIVEVRVDPQKIDQLKLDQDAALRFPGFNQRTTPELNGRVSRIAADVIQDQRSGQPYYLVRINLAPDEIVRLGALKLVPGMPVEAFIRTDERTMLSYLLKPLTDQARRAFREK